MAMPTDNYDIRSTTVFSDASRPLLGMNTRWGYISGYENFFKERIRFRVYFIVLALIGAYLLFAQPLLAVFALGAAAYFYQLYDHRAFVIGSARRIIQAQ